MGSEQKLQDMYVCVYMYMCTLIYIVHVHMFVCVYVCVYALCIYIYIHNGSVEILYQILVWYTAACL